MKPKKPKANEPSLRDKLSANVLRAIENDFAANGVAAVEALRQKSPEKYCEIATRLIAASEPKVDGYASCQSHEEIAVKLLESVGVTANDATDDMIKEAMAANDAFIAKLEAIRDSGQGPMQ